LQKNNIQAPFREDDFIIIISAHMDLQQGANPTIFEFTATTPAL
jgi:hypothetical protein